MTNSSVDFTHLNTFASSRPKWHLVYFALAVFDLITVSVSLYLNHRLVEIHTRSVQANQEWADRQRRFSELGQWANEVNVAVNNVFESGDVKEESKNMEESLRKFKELYIESHDDLSRNLTGAKARPMLRSLKNADTRMMEQILESERIFLELGRNQPDRSNAGRSMASMDRANAKLHTALAQLSRKVWASEESHFRRQGETANSLRKLEYVIAGAILFMIAGITLYGNKLSRHVRDNAIASEQHLAALSESEQKIRAIVNTAVDGIVTIDEHGTIESFNPAAERIFRCHADEVIGKNVNRFIPSPDAGRHDDYVHQYLQTGKSTVLGTGREVIAQRRDGTTLPIWLAVSHVRLTDRHSFTGIVRDITDRKRAERVLQFQTSKQEAVAELGQFALKGTELSMLLTRAAQLVAGVLDVEYCMVLERHPDNNTLLLRAGTGWKDGLVGSARIDRQIRPGSGFDLLSDEPVILSDFQSCPCPDVPLLRDHRVQSGISVVIDGHDGLFGVLGVYTARSKTFTTESGYFLRAIANVITSEIQREWAEQQKRERDQARAEQMAVVAQMATGLAHELRNPLTGIAMLVEKNREEMESRGLPADDLRIIEEEIGRIDRSLERYLSFARPSPQDRRPICLQDLVKRTFMLMEGQAARQEVDLVFQSTENPVIVDADWEQIQQLLLNLTLNALDVMPHGGTLSVEINSPSGGHVELRVLDSGPGILQDVLTRLFEPFVTTKETGVGLGLVVSRRIAEEHGGTLSAKNRPDRGACFVLQLPIITKTIVSDS